MGVEQARAILRRRCQFGLGICCGADATFMVDLGPREQWACDRHAIDHKEKLPALQWFKQHGSLAREYNEALSVCIEAGLV